MRIIEKESAASPMSVIKISPPDQPEAEKKSAGIAAVREEKSRPRPERKRHAARQRHSCVKFFGCLAVVLAIVAICVGYLVIVVAGPVVRAVDQLPQDFPKELALYQLDQAKIKVQSTADKQKLLQLLDALPEWSLLPLSDYLTTDLKTQLAAELKDPKNLPPNSTLNDLKGILRQEVAAKISTVSLSWKEIDKTKQELFDYYKKQLTASGFTVKDNLSDYEIDLSFFGPDMTGAMSIADNFIKEGSSAVNMTVNYLSQ